MTRLGVLVCVVILVASLVLTAQQLRDSAYPGSLASALIMTSFIFQQAAQPASQRQKVIGWTFIALAVIVLIGQFLSMQGSKVAR